MSDPKDKYNFFSHDIIKMIEGIQNDLTELGITELDDVDSESGEGFGDLNDLTKEINNIVNDEDVEGKEEFSKMKDIPDMMKAMEKLMEMMKNVDQFVPKY